MSRAEIIRWVLIGGAAAMAVASVLPAAEPADDPETPLLELLSDNEIPNPIIDDLLGLGVDVVNFLARMVPD